MIGSDVQNHKRIRGARVPGARSPDDTAIPAPAHLQTTTTPRAFVESFLVAVGTGDAQVVHETYLHERFKQQFPQAPFVRRMGELIGAVGELEFLAIQHLRQKNGVGSVPDQGQADYVLVFDRDRRVEAHVEFVRGADGLWKVTTYSLDSPQLQRLYQAGTAVEEAEPERDSEAEAPPSP